MGYIRVLILISVLEFLVLKVELVVLEFALCGPDTLWVFSHPVILCISCLEIPWISSYCRLIWVFILLSAVWKRKMFAFASTSPVLGKPCEPGLYWWDFSQSTCPFLWQSNSDMSCERKTLALRHLMFSVQGPTLCSPCLLPQRVLHLCFQSPSRSLPSPTE